MTDDASATSDDPPAAPPPRWTPALVAVIAGAVLAVQIPVAIELVHPHQVFEANHAKAVLVINAVLALITIAVAGLVRGRGRALALLPGGLLLGGMLLASVTAGGRLGDLVAAVLTVAGAWWVGRVVLRALRAPALTGVVVMEFVIGLAVVGLVVLVFGRLGIIAWWNVGLAVIAAGALGAWTGGRAAWETRDGARRALLASPISVACAGLLLLQAGWAVVWLSAPEIMYDALTSKAYLPELWSRTGEIGTTTVHPVLNFTGLAEIAAVPAHALGAAAVGGGVQFLAWGMLVLTVWWWGRRSVVGPLAALAVGVVPQIVWQSTTSYDDLLLVLGVVALTLAVLRTVTDRGTDPGWRTAVGIGLLAGACTFLKFNLLVEIGVLAVGWVVVAGPWRGIARRAGGVLVGAVALAGPILALRWIDTGNPVFPAYNDIFRSPDYLPVRETFNFPYWKTADLWDALTLPYTVIVHSSTRTTTEAMPPGAYGLLVAAIVLAVFFGWRQRHRRAALVVWLAVIVSLVSWWINFRYLRYTLPIALSAVVLVVAQMRGWRPGRRTATVLLLAAGAASVLYLPSTVASFWNVPGHGLPFSAAFGRWDREDYLRTVYPDKDALAAFQRVAPSGALAISDSPGRLFLRDHDLTPLWEIDRRLRITGPNGSTAFTFRRLQRDGVGWVVVSDPNLVEGRTWLPALLERYGEPVFSDRGWTVFRLTEHPARPSVIASCDPTFIGEPGCWTHGAGPAPGLSAAEAPRGVARLIPVCPGTTVGVRLVTAAAGAPSTVALSATGPPRLSGHTFATVPPGTAGWVYATVPPDVHHMTVAVTPGAGGTVERVAFGVIGRCRATAR